MGFRLALGLAAAPAATGRGALRRPRGGPILLQMHPAWLWTACVLLAPAVQAGSWFRVTGPGTPAYPAVEVDLASIAAPLGPVEAILRVTYARPVQHPSGFRFRSFEALVRYRCTNGGLHPLLATYHAGPHGTGAQTGFENALTREGVHRQFLAALPPHARAALSRAACAQS